MRTCSSYYGRRGARCRDEGRNPQEMSAVELSQINLLDLDPFVTSVPHEWFTYLRQHAPVCRHPEGHDGPGFWIVTRYDDVVKSTAMLQRTPPSNRAVAS